MKRSFPLWATILTICGVIVLSGLGTWQVQRLHWKETLLADLASARADQDRKFSFDEIKSLAASGKTFGYGSANGRFLPGSEIFVGPRTWKGANGYHQIAVLMLKDGGAVAVNRGWVAADQKETVILPSQTVTITGLLRRPDHGNIFTPDNDPAAGDWFTIDLLQLSDSSGMARLAPMVLYSERESGGGDTPLREALGWQPPNNHLGYAVFWYGMAGLLIVIYWLRFIVRKETRTSPDR